MKQRIVIDFDDVIAETIPVFCDVVNNYQYQPLGGPVHMWEPEDFTQWDASKTTGLPEETVQKLFAMIKYSNVAEVSYAVWAIENLQTEGHTVHVVTANPNEFDIRVWMDKHGLSHVPLTSTPDKVAWMRARDFTMIIDDNPDTLQYAVEEGFLGVRFERPWNAQMSSTLKHEVLTFLWGNASGEETVRTWSDVGPLIEKLERDGELELKPVDFFKESVVLKADTVALKLHLESALDTPTDDDGVVTNEAGGKQTDLGARFDLLPALAVAEVAAVLDRGARKYGTGNWFLLSVEEIHNHTLGHAVAFNRTNDIQDLAHCATRALMALEIALREEEANGDGR